MEIKGFIESSLIEWEGNLSSVLFLPFCNLRCRYCHASALVLRSDELDTVPLKHVLRHLKGQKGWLDGVVITGGEPTLYEEELLHLIAAIRGVPLKVMVETNGTMPAMIERMISGRHLDAIAMDIKAPLESAAYKDVTGKAIPPDVIRTSIRHVIDSGLPHEFRITVVPGLLEEEGLAKIAPELEGSEAVAIQNFRPDSCLDRRLTELTPCLPEQMERFKDIVSPYTKNCIIRGREYAAHPRAEP